MPYDVKLAGAGLWMVYNKANDQGLTLHKRKEEAEYIAKYLNEDENRPSTKEKIVKYRPKSVREHSYVNSKRKDHRTS